MVEWRSVGRIYKTGTQLEVMHEQEIWIQTEIVDGRERRLHRKRHEGRKRKWGRGENRIPISSFLSPLFTSQSAMNGKSTRGIFHASFLCFCLRRLSCVSSPTLIFLRPRENGKTLDDEKSDRRGIKSLALTESRGFNRRTDVSRR